MGNSITRFDGRQIPGSCSRGSSVFAAFDWEDMVLESGQPIREKAVSERGRITDFPTEDRDRLTAKLGHYSKVQSSKSEDTVTWNVFGATTLDHWIGELLELGIGPACRPSTWNAGFWTRMPHPDTGMRQHGPESEVSLTAGAWRYEFESKWLQDLDGKQGKDRQQSQISMRAYCAQQGDVHPDQWGVVVIAPSPPLYPPARKASSVFRRYFQPEGHCYRALPAASALRAVAITWEQILAMLKNHPSHDMVAAYLTWRLKLVAAPADPAQSPRLPKSSPTRP